MRAKKNKLKYKHTVHTQELQNTGTAIVKYIVNQVL